MVYKQGASAQVHRHHFQLYTTQWTTTCTFASYYCSCGITLEVYSFREQKLVDDSNSHYGVAIYLEGNGEHRWVSADEVVEYALRLDLRLDWLKPAHDSAREGKPAENKEDGPKE